MSTARSSTLSHMNRLIAAATMVGTVACNKCNSLPGGGYAVVDPMPSPARCPGTVYGMTATANLVATDGGDPILEIELTEPTSPTVVFDTNDAGSLRVSVTNGAVVSQTRAAGKLRFVIKPLATVGGVMLTLSTSCDAGGASIVANVSWGTAPDGGKATLITLSEF
jgi:hypothetical protein